MTRTADETIAFEDVAAGDVLPDMVIDMDATRIVAGAIATRDFMPVHHDREYANAQGAPDIFMNILSDTGYCSRCLTDWAGPESMVKQLSIRLGVPVFPGHTLTYQGKVTGTRVGDDGAGLVDIEFRAAGDLGDHVSGTAVVDLPRRDAGTAPGAATADAAS